AFERQAAATLSIVGFVYGGLDRIVLGSALGGISRNGIFLVAGSHDRGGVGLAEHLLELGGLGVLRAQLERLSDGGEGVAGIAAARQRDGEVEGVVGIVRVAVDGLLKES